MVKWRWNVMALMVVLLLSVSVGCGGDDDDDDDDSSDDDTADTGDDDDNDSDDDTDDDDDTADDDAEPEGFFVDHPFLDDVSLWSGHAEAGDDPRAGQIGEFGVGNGQVFALVGTRLPYHTLRNIIGPDYEREPRFFSDKSFYLAEDGALIEPGAQSDFRVRRSDITLTQTEYDGVEMWTVDFAVRRDGVGDLAERALIRVIVIRNNRERAARNLRLILETRLGEFLDGQIVEEVPPKRMHLQPLSGVLEAVPDEPKAGSIALPDILSGDEVVIPIAMAFTYEDEDESAVFNAVEDAGFEALLDGTYDSWQTWFDQTATVTTPDDKFNDMIEGFLVTIKTQQAANGATCVMSEYTGTWTRDTMGPLLLYPAMGLVDDAKAMLDYYYMAALERGNIANSFRANRVFDEPLEPPDWDNLPTLTGREQAEQPSYLPIQYHLYFQQTGDLAPIAERWGMLRHALVHQNFQDECLLPFSGDETFRELIGIGFGYLVGGTVYEDLWYSANSMFLFVRAAEIMADFASRLGYDADEAMFSDLADEVRACTEEYFWLEDEGYYALMIDQDTLEPVRRPYEDVNTKPLWVGYAAGDDARQMENMLSVMDEIGAPDRSYLQTPSDPMYEWLLGILGATQGVFSGMTQGYYLSALTKMDHPAAESAFEVWEAHGNESGNVSEAMIRDDYSRVAYLREPFGFLADLTSRYRPWEGGIYAKAMVDYLFGYEAYVADGAVRLAPHLPSGWTQTRFTDAPFGEHDLDVTVSDDGGTRRVELANGTGTFELSLRIAVPGEVTDVRLNGFSLDASEYDVVENWDDEAVELEPRSVDAEDELAVEVAYE